MWVIQGDMLVSLPDGAPLPPRSIQVEPPPAFFADPRGFAIQDGALVPIERREREPVLKLTQSDIARIKAAIDAGIL